MKRAISQKLVFEGKVLATQIVEFDDKQNSISIAMGLIEKEREFLEKHIKIEIEEIPNESKGEHQ
jgi:hypothetical protein